MWQPITNLPDDWETLQSDAGLHSLAHVWEDQQQRLKNTQQYKNFMERMSRKIAIETGAIERLYTIDRGVTTLLIEQGLDASYIAHGSSNKPAAQVIAIIKDQENAINHVFDYVTQKRELTAYFIRQLHEILTEHQPYTEGVDQFGNLGRVELIRGDWKRWPNNPQRQNGTFHEYAPPEQVQPQMEQLIAWHQQHMVSGISPEVAAAWLHHRFTQIHPFQDGNGRVARNIATLVFLRAGWFPLVVLPDRHDENIARDEYIHALENADDGDLKPLIALFTAAQRRAFVSILSLSEDVISDGQNYQTALNSLAEHIKPMVGARSIQEAQSRAEQLCQQTGKRLGGLQTDLEQIGLGTIQRFTSDAETQHYYRYQIIETAKRLGYYANLNIYRCWQRLSIRHDQRQIEMVIAFHGLGREALGVMAAAPCAWQRSRGEDGEQTVEGLEVLSMDAFEFNYKEPAARLNTRYANWLEEVMTAAVVYLRKAL
jgi:Fic family protein